MAGQIRITPEQMLQRAADFSNRGADFEALIGQMQTLVDNLDSEWEGAGKESYITRWYDLKDNSFAKARQLIEEIAEALTKTANYYAEADAKVQF